MLGGQIEMETKLNIGMAIMDFLKKDAHARETDQTVHVIGMFEIIKQVCYITYVTYK